MGTYIDVVDTALLCGLDIRQSTLDKTEVQARCPYCSDYKYRMYLSRKPDNPTFFCHNCGRRGNAVILFADFNPMRRPMTTQEAYRFLTNSPNIRTQADPYFYSSLPAPVRIRPLWERNIIYMELLKLLKLTSAHRENLRQRGMSDAVINGSLYKSFPVDPEFRQWAADTLASRFDLSDMPGFYTQNNRWQIAKYGSGILTPVCTAENQIQGLQLRYDTVPVHRHLQEDGSLKEKRGCRFGWFSSANSQNGTGIKGYLHVVGNPNSDTVFLTEGVMKSDIASYLSGGALFVGLTGVNNTRFLAETLMRLRPRVIVECIDMDKRYNPHVMKALENIRSICIPLCQSYQPFDWPERFKGIDDYYLARYRQRGYAA